MGDTIKFSDNAEFLDRAIGVAAEAHYMQRDRSDRPYILHPLRVMHKLGGKVKGREDGDLILAAAVMHDVVEDTPVTLPDLKSNFPAKVTHLVDLLTHIKEIDGLTYRQYIERCATDPDAKLIKLADLHDNLFHPARREGWNEGEGSKKRYISAWFYLADGVWQ